MALDSNLKDLNIFLQAMKQDHLSKKDFTDAFKNLVTAVKNVQKELVRETDQMNAKAKKEATEAINEAMSVLRTGESTYKELLSQFKNEMRSDARTTLRMIDQNIQDIRESIPSPYDDSEILEEIQAVRNEIPDMPERFDPTDILERLEELEKLVGGVGKQVKSLQGSISVPSPVHWQKNESFTVGSSDTSVTLEQAVGQAGSACIVWYQGQALEPGNHYSVDGNKINFSGITFVDTTTITVSYWP